MNIGEEERGGNETLTRQAPDENTNFPKKNERVLDKYPEKGEDAVRDGLDEYRQHDEAECENSTYKDVDGDPNTKSHDHFEEMSKEILAENEEISKVYNQRDVEKIIREINEENPDMNGKELKAKAQEYLEEQAEKEHNLPGNRSRR